MSVSCVNKRKNKSVNKKEPFDSKLNDLVRSIKPNLFFGSVLLLGVIIFGEALISPAQKKNGNDTVSVREKKKNNVKEEVKTESETKTKILSRMEVKTGDTPTLLTLVVGQVTTIKLYEPSLDIFGDRLNLVISESNEKSANQNIYIIPTKVGIRRNLIIEMNSGKVEFEIQSIAVDNGKTAVYTREVEVKSPQTEKNQKSIENDIANLKESLAVKEREVAMFNDRLLQAVTTAQKVELKIQSEMMFALAKTKKGKTQSNSAKDWFISEIYSEKNISGNRVMNLFEIEYRGKIPSKFIEVKADGGSQIFWMPEKGTVIDGVPLKRGEKIKIAVIDFGSPGSVRNLAFVTENDVVKF